MGEHNLTNETGEAQLNMTHTRQETVKHETDETLGKK